MSGIEVKKPVYVSFTDSIILINHDQVLDTFYVMHDSTYQEDTNSLVRFGFNNTQKLICDFGYYYNKSFIYAPCKMISKQQRHAVFMIRYKEKEYYVMICQR